MKSQVLNEVVNSSGWTKHRSMVETFVSSLMYDPSEHGRYLNTFSFLEHLGSRYLLASHGPRTLDTEVMKHHLEEVRHAFALRRMAEKISGRSLTYDSQDMLAMPAARMYFGRLAVAARQYLGPKPTEFVAPALYFSAAIEIRALWIYAIHEGLLKKHKASISFAPILGEEGRHLELMVSCLGKGGDEALEAFVAISKAESELFGRFFQQLLRGFESRVVLQ